ncbi:MAG: Dabb family protein [Acidobacteria bacterium]|nr:Dabb family protein [Acidobacteriota bacterium]
MLRHIVLLRWKDELPAGHEEAVAAALRALPARGLPFHAYNVGPDLGMGGPFAYDFGVAAEFADEAAWRVYMDDPEHDRIRQDLIGPWVAERAVIQFES